MINVSLSHISKSFGKKVALYEVSAEIEAGSFFCVLGEPGAGKTTLLRIMAGLEFPEEGDIFFDGQMVTFLPTQKRSIAMVFQDFALYPHMSVFENIASPLRAKQLDQGTIEKKVQEVATFLKIEKLLDRLPAYISGGEKQRVAIARSLVKEPQLCLFDEPLINLDYKIREEMRAQFKLMQREFKQTIVFATPDPVDAMSMADRVLVLHKGEVQQLSSIWEAYYRPASVFVASYLGFPQMSLIEGELKEEGSDAYWESSNLKLKITPLRESISWEKETVLGIRPENILLNSDLQSDFIFRGVVQLSEVIGSDTIVHLQVGGLSLQAFVPGMFRAPSGTKVNFGWGIDDIYLFSRNTGKNLIKRMGKEWHRFF